MKRRFFPTLTILGFVLVLSGLVYAAPCTAPGSIKKVKKTRNATHEFVVFDVVMPPNPNYTVSSTNPPFIEDPSGNPISIVGPNYRKIRFTGVNWMCTIAQNFTTSTVTIKGVKKTGQFEGIVEYVIGYRNPSSRYVTTYYYDVGPIRKVVLAFVRW